MDVTPPTVVAALTPLPRWMLGTPSDGSSSSGTPHTQLVPRTQPQTQRLPPQLPSPHALHRRLAPTRVLPQPLRLLPSRPAWRHYPQELTVPLLLLPRVSQRTKWRRLSTCAIFLPKREAC